MSGTNCLAVAAVAFVGSHFLLSHPLRPGLVARLDERRFQGLYSLVALITFGVMLYCYHALGRQAALWSIGEAGWNFAAILMWLASIFLVGSFVGNPALPGARRVSAPGGVLAITRHNDAAGPVHCQMFVAGPAAEEIVHGLPDTRAGSVVMLQA